MEDAWAPAYLLYTHIYKYRLSETYGRIFYSFKKGEAGLDIYSRISSFIGMNGADGLFEWKVTAEVWFNFVY